MPLRNQISTTEHVIKGKGESNDKHSSLARRQPCIVCIERNISCLSRGMGLDRVISLEWFQLSLRYQERGL